MAGIDLKNVTKIYGNAVVAVDDVSLEIKDGEFMIFLGPSGCGKSTTLRMIGGLESISKGDLLIDGRRMNDVDPAQRDIAIVFQNYALYPHMTVAGNLGFGLKLRGVDRGEIDRRIRAISEMLDIGPLLERKPAQLSGGQRQRVALGRALVREPKAFLLDEPLSNLDAKLRAAMRTELIKLHQKVGTTIIHVTHDQIEAMTMGQRICIMKDGRIVQVGAPLDVYRNPVNTFVAGFLASPPMNLVPGRLDGQIGLDAVTGLAALPIPEALRPGYASHAEKSVTVGLRPEDFHLLPLAGRSAPVSVTAVAIELLGPEVILVAELGGTGGPEIQARMPRDFLARPGETLTLHYDLTQIHLFDPATGNVLVRPRIA
ncbi:carbohydrate ABC transporter ATP-binding protein (CUT1 family) [Dongia mobilis]|uniref:Carbohydrate ABC transporter ATP-binding protein (CUT1 family) n=1 Tax=Dongia mobilis TaxID=578943 RepID=A0A4R6WR97_9PROT|nr:sn-glycerol-3-phosphate ABC transporter ATP-binding protein UgpC [Dongia mobilis]TDQ84122.1 carbohydrate ABC transporter ATP-binding protein (CUT1 family) [Dongia mobilis]